VAIEEQFYLVWPLLFVMVRTRWQWLIFVAVIAGSSAFRAAHHNKPLVLYYHTFAVISDMAVGGLAAYLALHSRHFLGFWKRLSRWTILGGYTAGVLLLMHPGAIGAVTTKPLDAAFGRMLSALFFAFVILEQNYSDHSCVKLVRWRTGTAIGKYTYGLYLLHPLAITAVTGVARACGWGNPEADPWLRLGSGTTALVLSLLMATASYRWFERPFLAAKDAFRR
jgi:peptidoglycan/LPS O-acetylase OafA/YrhL